MGFSTNKDGQKSTIAYSPSTKILQQHICYVNKTVMGIVAYKAMALPQIIIVIIIVTTLEKKSALVSAHYYH